MSETANTEPPHFNFYRLAGEFFGHLREALGFGSLHMSYEDASITAPPSMRYIWIFQARGRFSCQVVLDHIELSTLIDIKSHAKVVAEDWKNHFRQLSV